MALEDVVDLTETEIQTLEAGAHPWLGQHYVEQGHANVWLRFNEQQGLEWVTLSKMDGWRIMATRQSPRRNLCTGELTYRVELLRTVALEGATVFLDGEEVQPESGYLSVPAGAHELRLEKAGYQPIIRNLRLGPEDRGDQRVDLTQIELEQVNPS